jgi:hypothetical protein
MLLSLLDVTLVVLQPLFLSTPIDAGGLGLDPATIGLILGAFHLVFGILDTICLAWLCRTLGTGQLYRTTIALFFVAIWTFPMMSWIAKSQGLVFLLWAVMGVQFVITVLNGMAFRESLNHWAEECLNFA